MTIQTRIINIQGMTCGGCVKGVHNAVADLAGVQTVSVDLDNNLATVSYNIDLLDIQQITDAIEDAGFEASAANN